MLRQAEKGLEIENKKYNECFEKSFDLSKKLDGLIEESAIIRRKAKEYEREIETLVNEKFKIQKTLDDQVAINNMYYDEVNLGIKENSELKRSLDASKNLAEVYKDRWQAEVKKSWWRKLING